MPMLLRHGFSFENSCYFKMAMLLHMLNEMSYAQCQEGIYLNNMNYSYQMHESLSLRHAYEMSI